MKRKNIFIMVVIAALIPVMIFSIDVINQPKILTIIDSLVDELTIEELIEKTPLIIKGTVQNSITEVNPNDPTEINTVWSVNISKVLKGNYSNSTIDVKLRGGETSTHLVQVEGAELASQEEVILFLGQTPNSDVYGDSYHLYSQYTGKYTVKNGQLTTYIPEFNTSEKELRNKIQSSLQ